MSIDLWYLILVPVFAIIYGVADIAGFRAKKDWLDFCLSSICFAFLWPVFNIFLILSLISNIKWRNTK